MSVAYRIELANGADPEYPNPDKPTFRSVEHGFCLVLVTHDTQQGQKCIHQINMTGKNRDEVLRTCDRLRETYTKPHSSVIPLYLEQFDS